VISGTPSVIQPPTAYTVTGTLGQASASVVVSIVIVPIAPVSILYPSIPTLVTGVQMVSINPTVNGSPASSFTFSVNQNLPSGLSLNPSTGGISGTPTQWQKSVVYTVTVSNSAGSVSTTFTIVINPTPCKSLSYSSSTMALVYGQPVSFSPTPVGCDPTSLTFAIASGSIPAGLTFSSSTGTFGGAPIVSIGQTGTYNAGTIQVTATNSGGSVETQLGFTVIAAAPSGLIYHAQSIQANWNTPIQSLANVVPSSVTGGPILTLTYTAVLPVGLTIDPNAGTITGSPTTAPLSGFYTVTAKNTAGSTTCNIFFQVNPIPPTGLSYSMPAATSSSGSGYYKIGVPLTILPLPTVSPGATSEYYYSVSPALDVGGLTFNTATGVITGTPTASMPRTCFSVTLANSFGSTPQVPVCFGVTPN